MSFLSASQCELIYSGFTAGAALSASVTQTVISPRGNTTPLPYLPANFFNPAYGANKAIKVVARGIVSTASSSPGTITAGVYFASSDTATVGTSTGAVTGAFTPATSLSSAIWEFEATLTLGAPGPVPNLYNMGAMQLNPAAASGLSYGVGATSATTALSTENPYYIQFVWTWGTNSASNSVTMYQTEIWGLN